MELMYGAPGKRGQDECRQLLDTFAIVYLTREDMDWAMGRLAARRLSHGVAVVDCLIASVCQRLQVPLYSHNVGHMHAILGPELAVKPY